MRSALGRVTSHPRAICVNVMNGTVTLTGDVLEAEAPAVESAVAAVRGVEAVRCDLRTYSSGDGIPSLQGGANGSAGWSGWMSPDNWSPTACAACAGLTIGAVALAAMRVWGNGHSSAGARDPKSVPVEEGAGAFMTAAPSEADYGPNTFFS